MDLTTASNAINTVVEAEGSGLLSSFITGVVTGLISSVMVTVYFEHKEHVRQGKVYIDELHKCCYELFIKTMPLRNLTDKAVDELAKEMEYFTVPVQYSWFAFNRTEKAILSNARKDCLKIQENVLQINIDNMIQMSSDMILSDKEKAKSDCKQRRKELIESWQSLSEDLKKLRMLSQNYCSK